ncbi:DNA recombination protein RmuC [Stygiobacter electus]|uniref:DNA recombination protein RmuC n=1 Tax=Stygiobacter electus TaxID=3032292 RepID=A0AAE3NZD8_9BACT|nr:DNA recombination protein RmuC [Stygiobacter electus]MDF1612861.1 DNA recombination protein RmuC [Stygiobacter electus]
MEIVLIITLITVLILSFLVFNLNKKINSFEQITYKEEFERLEKSFRDEISRSRSEINSNSKEQREEISGAVLKFGEQLSRNLSNISEMQKNQLDHFANQLKNLTQTNEDKFRQLQEKVENQLKEIQDKNEKKLEEMRLTVDEKLHSTLEKRLSESFSLVSDRLEAVREGLGEMRNLASGVGDLKRVLTNVKTRGTWGEIQLENLIEQILTREQYEKNFPTKKESNDRVEFAIKMPGRNDQNNGFCYLPIDAKFPIEDYQRLVQAQENGDVNLVDEASKAIEARIKLEAKSIKDKYIDPPNTTDVAILFLPVEGLYAEVLRRPGLFEKIQNDFKVIIAGPTTISAILNSLQMGFRTLAIEKRSSEVWSLLSIVKSEFIKFGEVLDKTQEKLEQASKQIDSAKTRTRVIERKLKDVEINPSDEIKLIE